MNGLDENNRLLDNRRPANGVRVVDTEDDFDLSNPARSVIRQLRRDKAQAELTAQDYKNKFENERENRIRVEREKDKLEEKLARTELTHNHDIERVKDKYERELEALNNDTGLGSIAKEVITPEVLKETLPLLINGLMTKGQAGNLPQLTGDAKELLNWYQKLTPDFKVAFDLLITTVAQAGPNGANIINQFLEQHGTQFEQQAQ